MHTFFKASVFASAAVMASILTPVSAQEVGRVISSTPVMKRVTEPARGCRPEPQRACELITEDRVIGYKVVYDYKGQQQEVQLPFPAGATIPIETSGNFVSTSVTPTVTPTPVYEIAPRVVERVYVEPRYPRYYSSYYDPYFYGPVLPALGIGLGLGYLSGRYYWPRGHVVYRGGWRGGHR